MDEIEELRNRRGLQNEIAGLIAARGFDRQA